LNHEARSAQEVSMKVSACVIGAAALAAAALPAFAHHSYAEFANDKTVTVTGTLKEFQWTNPHSWLLVMVPNAKGVPEQWALELNSVSMLAAKGWKPKTVLPGDKISVTFHPMKNGTRAGSSISVKLPSGKVMGGTD
jgi:hypothetical protein